MPLDKDDLGFYLTIRRHSTRAAFLGMVTVACLMEYAFTRRLDEVALVALIAFGVGVRFRVAGRIATNPRQLKLVGDRVLILLLPSKDVEGLLGDLEEIYSKSMAKYGLTTARLRYARRYAEIVWDKTGSKVKVASLLAGLKMLGVGTILSHIVRHFR
jgi:hypothetical protein